MRHVVLDNKRDITIPAPTVLKSGMEVIRIKNKLYSPYQYGDVSEDIGIIETIGTTVVGSKAELIASVRYTGGHTSTEPCDMLVAYVDLQSWVTATGKTLSPIPKYRVDQVLFVRPITGQRSNEDYPAVNSPFETDVKVTDVYVSKFGSVISYRVYMPRVGYRTYDEENLMTAKERERMLHTDFKEYLYTQDALPFFKRGEKVKTFGGYLYNLDETVIIELNDELKKYLSWSIKQE